MRPEFKQVKALTSHASPEALFYKLSRQASHGYLRGPQQDVLREYAEKGVKASDVAFELPTGTGKTVVGLLLAEWRRLTGAKVAFLSLTNQLSGQVLAEGRRLGVQCADLRGTKDTRSPGEEGRYRTGSAIGVTTYSNLFNIRPVIGDAELLLFDDAHGGEHYVTSMWEVAVGREDQELYNSLLSALSPGLTTSQITAIGDPSSTSGVHMPDITAHPECLTAVMATLDPVTSDGVRFAWRLIRSHLASCLFLISPFEVTIRPLVPPTHTHQPFATATQRVYMSATLGGESDLLRAYGILKVEMIRAKTPQWGRRFVFVPGVHADEKQANEVVARVWDGLKSRRAVLLAPSDRSLNRTYSAIEGEMTTKPTRLGPADVANTLDSFVQKTEVILALAGRYDGLDFPDEQCRLLVMCDSPAAINPLERHLIERWKMGPVMRQRERTRLIQGMGRCTRNATDFAVIVWLGQSLVNAATSSQMKLGLPSELASELNWGIEQSSLPMERLVEMMLGLVEDPDYRKTADADIQGATAQAQAVELKDFEQVGTEEVSFGRALWDEDFRSAYETARGIVDKLVSAQLSGYRAWWNFLASAAASMLGEKAAERECLSNGAKCGVNSGWLNGLLTVRDANAPEERARNVEDNAEGLWDSITSWGWHGPAFEKKMSQMRSQLSTQYHAAFHEGLENLGKCLGATPTRVTEHGVPDVVWSFAGDFHIAFEAKTEKGPNSTLSKKNLLEAKGHADWVRARLSQTAAPEIEVVVVAQTRSLHELALPFVGDLCYVPPDEFSKLAAGVIDGVRKLRLAFAGRDFAEAAVDFSAKILASRIDLASIRKALLSQRLSS